MFWGLAMGLSSVVYIVVSLVTGRGKKAFDMDRMLHRGVYQLKAEYKVIDAAPIKGWRVLGMGREFTKFDRVIYIATYAWTLSWVIVFTIGTIMNLTGAVGSSTWLSFWKTYVWIYLAASIVVLVWFSTGGLINLRDMIKALKTMTRDHADDGFVHEQKKESRRP